MIFQWLVLVKPQSFWTGTRVALKIYKNLANSQKKLQGYVVAFREVMKKNLGRGAFCQNFQIYFQRMNDVNKTCNSPLTKLMASTPIVVFCNRVFLVKISISDFWDFRRQKLKGVKWKNLSMGKHKLEHKLLWHKLFNY